MREGKLKTNDKQVQTIIHCYPFIVSSSKDSVNVSCNRASQTVASVCLDRPNLDLYPLLEFTPYQLIAEGAIREIDLPREPVLHWKLEQSFSELRNLKNSSEKNTSKPYKSSLKNIHSTNYNISSMSSQDEPKLANDIDTQTDISVSPHVLHVDEVASIFADASMQTTITCLPTASVSTILPQLKSNLVHEKSNLDENDNINEQPLSARRSVKWQLPDGEDTQESQKEHLATLSRQIRNPGAYQTNEDKDEFEEALESIDIPVKNKKIETSGFLYTELPFNAKGKAFQLYPLFNETFQKDVIDDYEPDDETQPEPIDFGCPETDNAAKNDVEPNDCPDNEPEQDKSEAKEPNDCPDNEPKQDESEATEPNEGQGNEADQDESKDKEQNDEPEQNVVEDKEPDENNLQPNQLEDSNGNETNAVQEQQPRDVGSRLKNNCSCGSDALKMIADQLRNQALTIQLTPALQNSNTKFEAPIKEALGATMSVLQTEIARLIDILSNNEDIASTSCGCINSPLTDKDTVRITIDENRNTLHIKINQYTEMDEMRISHNPPGDHSGHTSNHVDCECEPSHSGAAPPRICSQCNSSSVNTKKIKSRRPIASSRVTTLNNSCCNKTSNHKSKIPTAVLYNQATSIRGKQSMTKSKEKCGSNKTCSTNISAGVQTVLALGDRLQSESLSSLECCSNNTKSTWNNLSLPLPGTYSIKSVGKKYPSANQTYRRKPAVNRTDQCCGPHTEIAWNDILLSQPGASKNTYSEASCACNSSSIDQGRRAEICGKLSNKSITTKKNSAKQSDSKSATNLTFTYEINAKQMPSVPVQNVDKTKVCIKIVGLQNKEIIKEMLLEPGNKTMILDLDDLGNEPKSEGPSTKFNSDVIDEEPLPDTSKIEVEQDESERTTDAGEIEEERAKTETNEVFAPAECGCTDNIILNTFKPDPVMAAMETCEAEMKPLRQALKELQMKVRDLNIPEMKGCICRLATEQNNVTVESDKSDFTKCSAIEEPSMLNSFGPCPFFKPAKFYVPEIKLPFGHLPPPALMIRKPVNVYAPFVSYQRHNSDNNKSRNHSCTCKKRKSSSQKGNKIVNTHKKTKKKPCEVHISTEEPYHNDSNCCMYVSTMDMNSPFIYKHNSRNSEHKGSKQFQIYPSCSKKSSSMDKHQDTALDDSYHNEQGNVYKTENDTTLHNKEDRKQKKKKYRLFNKYDIDASIPYHSVFDVQNLRPGQAMKTGPDDFLLPFKESMFVHESISCKIRNK